MGTALRVAMLAVANVRGQPSQPPSTPSCASALSNRNNSRDSSVVPWAAGAKWCYEINSNSNECSDWYSLAVGASTGQHRLCLPDNDGNNYCDAGEAFYCSPPSAPPPPPMYPPLPEVVANALAAVLGTVNQTESESAAVSDQQVADHMQALAGVLEETSTNGGTVPQGVVVQVVEAIGGRLEASRELKFNASGLASNNAAGGGQEEEDKDEDIDDVVVAAAALVDAVMAAADSVDEGTTVAATAVISSLVGELEGQSLTTATGEATRTNASAAASSLQSAVAMMTSKVVDSLAADATPVEITSGNLNITLVTRSEAYLAEPIAAKTATSHVRVALPPGLLGMLGAEADADKAVAVVLTVMRVNLHGGITETMTTAGPTADDRLIECGLAPHDP